MKIKAKIKVLTLTSRDKRKPPLYLSDNLLQCFFENSHVNLRPTKLQKNIDIKTFYYFSLGYNNFKNLRKIITLRC